MNALIIIGIICGVGFALCKMPGLCEFLGELGNWLFGGNDND
jgi:hypothetical protein